MDSFEWNKILGAILGTLLFLFIVNEVSSIVFHGEEPKEMGYKIEVPKGGAETKGEEKPEAVDFGALLQTANAQAGETIAKRCLQCHTFAKDGPNKTGPNLWGVLGRQIASKSGFKYSSALSKLDGDWTYDKVYHFVAAPSKYAPGTNMTFAGLRRKSDRIDLLAFLRTQSDSPPPIPAPLPEENAGEGAKAPAEAGAPQGEESGAADGGTAPEQAAPPAETGGKGEGTQPEGSEGEAKSGGEDAKTEADDASDAKTSDDKGTPESDGQ